ncbi:MAG: cell division protein ZapA [Tranquillimonas sp.]|jgi:cell division protein ZapA
MPDVKISVGNRDYEVACQPGEEHFLQSAARLLDVEATTVLGQFGRLPDARMLLMAGLMLADKTAGLEERNQQLTASLRALQAEIEALRAAPAPEPQRIEVPVVPHHVVETMAELAARAEAIAATVEERAASD